MRIIFTITLTILVRGLFSQAVTGTYSVTEKRYSYQVTLNSNSTFESSEIETGHLFVLYYAKGNWTINSDTLILNITKLGTGKKEELTDELMATVNYHDVFLITKSKMRLIKRNGHRVKHRTILKKIS